MKKNVFQIAGYSLIILLLSSCSSSKLLPTNVSTNAKSINTPENKALVYVFRKSSLGAAVGLRVDCNNIELVKLYPKKFYLCALDPGKYIFTGHGENEDELLINIEQGNKYYIEAIPKMGLAYARCQLELVDPIEGVEKLQKCKLIGVNEDAQKALNYSPPTE